MTTSGQLDRRIQFQRFTLADDGFSSVGAWANHGAPVWARRRYTAGNGNMAARVDQDQVVEFTDTKFEVRSSAFSRGITVNDRLICDGETFEIKGIQPIGRDMIEIKGRARAGV